MTLGTKRLKILKHFYSPSLTQFGNWSVAPSVPDYRMKLLQCNATLKISVTDDKKIHTAEDISLM
jgi:hypothetical protein